MNRSRRAHWITCKTWVDGPQRKGSGKTARGGKDNRQQARTVAAMQRKERDDSAVGGLGWFRRGTTGAQFFRRCLARRCVEQCGLRQQAQNLSVFDPAGQVCQPRTPTAK